MTLLRIDVHQAKSAPKRAHKRAKHASTFRVREIAQGPAERWGYAPSVDATEKYLALSGSLLRSCKHKAVRYQRPTATDKHYDVSRARGYFQAITGRTAGDAVWADVPVHDEKHCRIRWVMDGKALWEIPHWDWNGHNATVEDCIVLPGLSDIFA